MDAAAAARLAHEWLVAEAPQVVEVRSGRNVGEGLIQKIEGRVARLRRMDDFIGGKDLNHLVERELAATVDVLRNAVYDERRGKHQLVTQAGPAVLAPGLSTVPTSAEQRTDESDWQTFRQLDTLADHWWWRPERHPDRHYLTWYVVFDDPDLRTYMAGIQHELSVLDYLDPVPPDGIHMTVQGVAFADTLTTAQVDAVGAEARRLCADSRTVHPDDRAAWRTPRRDVPPRHAVGARRRATGTTARSDRHRPR